MQKHFCALSIEFKKISITKFINVLDIVLKFIGAYNGKSLSKPLVVSFRASPEVLCCIKAMAYVLTPLIKEKMDKNMMIIHTGKANTDAEVLRIENDLSLDGFLPSNTKIVYGLRDKRVHLSGEYIWELDIAIPATTGRKIRKRALTGRHLF